MRKNRAAVLGAGVAAASAYEVRPLFMSFRERRRVMALDLPAAALRGFWTGVPARAVES